VELVVRCMGYNGEDMIGYTVGQYYAVVAVDNICGNGHLIDWEETVPQSVKELETENNWLGETEFRAVEAGLYFAELRIDDEKAEWAIVVDDCNISGYEIIGALNQKVSDMRSQIYT